MRLLGSVPLRLGKYVRLSRTRCDQFGKIASYERTPAARAISVAFDSGPKPTADYYCSDSELHEGRGILG